jgi:O-antigen/teichoic acid export membrane protein
VGWSEESDGGEEPRRRTTAQTTVRLLGNIVDQGLSSLTNLLVSLFAAHLLGLESFGVVSVAMTTYFVCVGIGRAVVGDPLLLTKAEAQDVVGRAVSAAFALGVLFTLCSWVAWSVAGGSELMGALLVLGVGLPFLLLQDIARYIAFWRGSPWSAAANDLLWLVGALGSLALLPRAATSASTVLACWVASGGVAGLVFAVRLRWRPSIRAASEWLRGNRTMILPMLGDYGLIALLQQGVIYLITAVVGLRATAAFRGALVALGPVNVLTAGVSVFLVQLARRAQDTTPTAFPGRMLRLSALMAVAVLALCLAVYFMPTRLGELLLDEVWAESRPLILPLAFVFATAAFNFGATTGLRVIGQAARSFRVRAIAAPLMLVVVAVACYQGGVMAAVVAQAVAGGVATLLWWRTFLVAHRRSLRE